MPSRRARMSFARWIPNDYFSVLSLGFVPMVMEDKWFAYMRDNRLHLHRSWTGNCVFEVRFERLPGWMGGGYLATETVVNRDAEQYGATDDREDIRLLDRLVHNLCRRNAGLPET